MPSKLLIFLHGLGGSERSARRWLPSYPDDVHLETPNGLYPLNRYLWCGSNPSMNFAWYLQIDNDRVRTDLLYPSLAALKGLIQWWQERYDPKETILAGFSQGGTMAVTFPLVYPGIVDRSVCFAGYIVDDEGVPISPESVEGTKFLWVHGQSDFENGHAYAEKGVENLRKVGAEIEFLSLPNVGHTVPRAGMDRMWDFIGEE